MAAFMDRPGYGHRGGNCFGYRCIQVFDEELFDLFHHDLVKVKITGAPKKVSELMHIAQKAVGDKKKITSIK